MPALTLERKINTPLEVVATYPVAAKPEPIIEDIKIITLFPIERFHDQKLGRLIAALVTDQRQNYYVNPTLVTRVATRTASITENPSRKTGHALSKMIAKLEDRVNSTDAVNSFISTINPINNVHPLSGSIIF